VIYRGRPKTRLRVELIVEVGDDVEKKNAREGGPELEIHVLAEGKGKTEDGGSTTSFEIGA